MSATILQFPQRNKGRVRKSTGANADGVAAMVQFGGAGDNIVHFQRDCAMQRISEPVARMDLQMYLIDKIMQVLPKDAIAHIRRSAMIDAAFRCESPSKRDAAVTASHLLGAFPA